MVKFSGQLNDEESKQRHFIPKLGQREKLHHNQLLSRTKSLWVIELLYFRQNTKTVEIHLKCGVLLRTKMFRPLYKCAEFLIQTNIFCLCELTVF